MAETRTFGELPIDCEFGLLAEMERKYQKGRSEDRPFGPALNRTGRN